MDAKQLQKELTTLAINLGFGKVTSYASLYKTTINTFAKKGSSMWFFTIPINMDDQVCGIELNKTYFDPTPQTELIEKHCTFSTPMDIKDVITLIKNN